MKKSFLALLISSAMLVTACEDRINTQKLLDAEKNIMQLESELRTTKAELEKAKTIFPALNVEIVELFNQSEKVKSTKEQKEEFDIESSEVQVFASIPKTNVEWLNQLLLGQLYNLAQLHDSAEESQTDVEQVLLKSEEINQEIVIQQLQRTYRDFLDAVKEAPTIGMFRSLESQYLGQRNHIASFSVLAHDYMGGAHGLFMTHYFNVDTHKQKVISLEDLLDLRKLDKLKKELWQIYSRDRTNEKGEYYGFAEENDIRISENFYFNKYGIVFVYPPYELGSFAEGEVELELDWSIANEYLNKDYQRTKKDGFELSPIEL